MLIKESNLQVVSSYATNQPDKVLVVFDGKFLDWCFYANKNTGEAHIYVTNERVEMLGQAHDAMRPLVHILQGDVEILEVAC